METLLPQAPRATKKSGGVSPAALVFRFA